MKILAFGDIHFHHTHRFSHITPDGFTVRELEHLQCADVILDLVEKEKIDKVVFLGDLWSVVGDNMSCQTLHAVTEFFYKFAEKHINIYAIVGNHDLGSHIGNRYSHKLKPFMSWTNMYVYDKPTITENFVYMPYCISDEQAQTFLENIPDKENKIVFSHLEIKGFPLGNGIETQHGVELSLLKQFKMVLQGHYHCGGSLGKNIQIAGSTQRLSFKDQGKARDNILIYDTETNTVERRSFNCPDWLTFTDDNIDDILKISNDNYVKLDITTDLLLTPEIKAKLSHMKGTDIHIDITRLSINRNITEEVQPENEVDIITQFVNKSDNDEEQKKELINEGIRLLDRVKNT